MSKSPPELFERISRSANEAVVRLRVRSALNPALFACGLISVPAIMGSVFTSGRAQAALLVLAFLPVLLTCSGFLFFMFRDPDKLQSEEYQLQKKALDIIEEKGGTIAIAATSLEAIANPQFRRIGSGEEDSR